MNDSLLTKLISVHYPFPKEFLELNSQVIKSENCLYADGHDWGAGLVTIAKYGLCYNKNVDISIFSSNILIFETDGLGSYDYTGFHWPEHLPLDIDCEKKYAQQSMYSFISHIDFCNADFYKYLSTIDESEYNWDQIEEIENQKSEIEKSLLYIDGEFEFLDMNSLISLMEISSKFLSLNTNFYNKIIEFLNNKVPNWFEQIFARLP